MTDQHNKSFFGQNAALFAISTSRSDPFLLLKFIKKLPNGAWEKPSKREGKTVKCSLEEMVSMLEVLDGKVNAWSTYHKFKGDSTQISFNRDNEQKVWVNVNKYAKMLSRPEVEVFRRLMNHLIDEKIEFGTNSKGSDKTYSNGVESISEPEPEVISPNPIQTTYIVEESNYGTVPVRPKSETKVIVSEGKDKSEISAYIKSTSDKALLLQFQNGNEKWLPRSTIHSEFAEQPGLAQAFLVDNWILKKNKII